VKIACAQTEPKLRDLSSNLDEMKRIIESCEADLIVFPELSLSGYFFLSKEEILPYSFSTEDEIISVLCQSCRDHKRAIVFGFAERSGDKVFNSSVLIDSKGEIIGLYRKVHLFYYETIVFSPGDLGFPVFDLQLENGSMVKIGMQICYDWRFPEATRSLALRGAEVVVIPSNIVTTTDLLIDTLRVRAFENKVIVAFSDRVGSEEREIQGKREILGFRGESCIINYNGELLKKCSTDEMTTCYALISPSETTIKNVNLYSDIIKDRRNSMYYL
jgi:predicted amidohydrolase